MTFFPTVATICGVLAAANLDDVPAETADRIASIVIRNCVRCHNQEDHKGGLNLSTREGFLRGGDLGPAVVVGDPDQSRLMRRASEGSMPPIGDGDMLSSEELAVLREWIATGAPWPAGLVARRASPSNLQEDLQWPTRRHRPGLRCVNYRRFAIRRRPRTRSS